MSRKFTVHGVLKARILKYVSTDLMDMGLGGLRQVVMDREAWSVVVHGSQSPTQLSD